MAFTSVEHHCADSNKFRPSIRVGFAASHNVYQTFPYSRADGSLLNIRSHLPTFVRQTLNVRNSGCSAGSKTLGETSIAVSGEQFVHRESSFFNFQLHLSQECNCAVANQSAEYCSTQRWCDNGLTEHKENIHDAALFDEAAFDSIEPANVMKTRIPRVLFGNQSRRVVAGRLDVSRAAWESSDIVLSKQHFQRRVKVSSHGAGEDDEQIFLSRLYANRWINRKVCRPNIE